MIFRHRIATSAACAALALALTGAARHITPTVVLTKQADMIRGAVPDGTHFFVRTVDVGRGDFDRIRQEGGFKPEEKQVKFFYGQDDAGRLAGIVLFPQVNTQHGPLEIGLAMNPDGTIREVVTTKATVETKPWVLTAVKTGFLSRFRGLRAGDDPSRARASLSEEDTGRMPYYMAGVITEAVDRGLVLYDVLYRAD